MSENPLGSAEKRSSISCIVSGVIFILIGAVIIIGIIINIKKHTMPNITAVIMLGNLSFIFILVGIFQLIAKQREKRREATIVTPGTRANRRYEEKRVKAIEKQIKKLYVHRDIRAEIYNGKLKNATIRAVITAAVGVLSFLIFFDKNDTDFLFFGIVSFSIGIGGIVYYLYGREFRKIKDIISKLKLNYDSVNEDFISGKCFKVSGKVLCIGKKYTVYSDGASSIVFDNSYVYRIAPYRYETDHCTNFIYTGKKATYYVAVTLKSGSTHYLMCRQFVDEMIIEEYMNQNRNSI